MGAEASCTAGQVTRVIIDPDTQAVTHLVIEPRYRLGATCRRKYVCHHCTYDYYGCDSCGSHRPGGNAGQLVAVAFHDRGVRREALLIRVEVRDLRRWPAAAGW